MQCMWRYQISIKTLRCDLQRTTRILRKETTRHIEFHMKKHDDRYSVPNRWKLTAYTVHKQCN
jgi:hypothetical protein